MIGIRLSGGAADAMGGRIGSGLRGTGVAIFARRESVVGLGGSERGERVEIADAIQNDAAVEIGGCEARIILNRQIV